MGEHLPQSVNKHSIQSKRTKHKDTVVRKRLNEQAYKRQAKRQYKTNSRIWRAIRDHHLSENPLCVECDQGGIKKLATVVDHIDGDSWNNNHDNLQSLCASHHNKKTAKVDGGFGHKK